MTRCVEPSTHSLTVSCHSNDHMIAVRSAQYARLPVDRAGFCAQPTPNNNHGECVPHADADRNNAAGSCNTYHSCVLYPNYYDIVSSCSNVTGPVYVNVDFECLSRER